MAILLPVAVIGLGSMGCRIAAVLTRAGVPVLGWNRSPRELEGVRVESDIRNAVSASQLVIAVPMSYENTREALAPAVEDGLLEGRTLLNLSWGTLQDAADMERWCERAGARYLDGSLLCYPDEIGTASARIVYAGSSSAADAVGASIATLGSVQYLGENASAANAVGTAAGMVFYHAALAAFYEAIAFASRFEVPPVVLLPEIRVMLDLLSSHFEQDISRIEAGDYANPTATIDVHLDGVRMAIADLDAVGQPSPLMQGFAQLVQPLANTGYGDQSIARLFDQLRLADVAPNHY